MRWLLRRCRPRTRCRAGRVEGEVADHALGVDDGVPIPEPPSTGVGRSTASARRPSVSTTSTSTPAAAAASAAGSGAAGPGSCTTSTTWVMGRAVRGSGSTLRQSFKTRGSGAVRTNSSTGRKALAGCQPRQGGLDGGPGQQEPVALVGAIRLVQRPRTPGSKRAPPRPGRGTAARRRPPRSTGASRGAGENGSNVRPTSGLTSRPSAVVTRRPPPSGRCSRSANIQLGAGRPGAPAVTAGQHRTREVVPPHDLITGHRRSVDVRVPLQGHRGRGVLTRDVGRGSATIRGDAVGVRACSPDPDPGPRGGEVPAGTPQLAWAARSSSTRRPGGSSTSS